VVGVLDGCDVGGGLGQPIEYKWKFKEWLKEQRI
jgi:hypothetical protein